MKILKQIYLNDADFFQIRKLITSYSNNKIITILYQRNEKSKYPLKLKTYFKLFTLSQPVPPTHKRRNNCHTFVNVFTVIKLFAKRGIAREQDTSLDKQHFES